MPKRDVAPIGAPCWIDLFTSDPAASRAFYGDLFGWTSEQAGEEYGGYINFFKDGVPVAGAMHNDGTQGVPDLWTVYLASADAKATVDAAASHGGQVHVPPMDVMDLGVMALVTDAGDAAIGVWQPGLHKGFGILAEPNTPNWFELHTRDYEASVQFYRDVFGWDTRVAGDTADFRYTTLGEGDDALAGIMDASAFLPEGVPAHWSIYFGAEDTDAALARIGELGGSTVMAGEDTPFGRLAAATDPTGAMFKLVGPNNA
ncbi:MAG: Glyoxalase/bleomycin resistance protein/dioxygenase [Acidimicrobiales bacterium]|nr:Glyoxalase/bleomycin resistance protein/dioxygenase [Acidimicrobiales bacterium]